MTWPRDGSWWWFPTVLVAGTPVWLGIYTLLAATGVAGWVAVLVASLGVGLVLRQVPPIRRQIIREWSRE